MSLIYVYKSLGRTFNMTAKDTNGDIVKPGANDKLRITIGRQGESAKLQFTSDSATANGSSITKNSSTGVNVLRLDASDLVFDPGVYSLKFELYDNADAEWKLIEKQVLHLEE